MKKTQVIILVSSPKTQLLVLTFLKIICAFGSSVLNKKEGRGLEILFVNVYYRVGH